MRDLNRLAVGAALASLDVSFTDPNTGQTWSGRRFVGEHFETPKMLSKRARRRLRGKTKVSRAMERGEGR